MENDHQERYSRQILLKEIGWEGQKIIAGKKVAIVGVGALGTVTAELLTRAGIGELLLIDRDVVEESNLQRQALFTEKDLGRGKALVAQEKLKEINSKIIVKAQSIHLNPENISLLKNQDLVLDGTDNLQTRFLLNDFCKKEKIPWIYAATIQTKGIVLPIWPNGPCLRCFMAETNAETCDTVGVLNTLTFSIAALQTTLALKMLLGKNLESVLYHYNIWEQRFRKIKVPKRKSCPTCQGNYEDLTLKETERVVKFCSSGNYQIQGKPRNLLQLKQRWEKIDRVQFDGAVLYFKNILLFADGRALIKAPSEQEAWAAYSKYVGN